MFRSSVLQSNILPHSIGAFHAAQNCLSIGDNEPETRQFLSILLEYLEGVSISCAIDAKARLSDQDAITNNLAARAYVENFALKIFDGADQEELGGNPTKLTAQRFLAAASFLEVVQSLTTQPESDILEKIKYSKWKAASISKAVREGFTTSSPAIEATSAGSSAAHTLSPIQPQPNSFSSSTSPLPPTGPSLDPWPTKELAPHSSSELPSPPGPSTPLSATHAAFPSTVFPPVYDSRPHQLPSVPLAGESIPSAPDLDPSRIALEPVIGVAPRHFPALAPQHPNHPVSPSAPSHDLRTSDLGPSLTSHILPAPLPTPPPTCVTNPLPAPLDIRPSAPAAMIDPKAIEEVQKHAKWAISALTYEDIATARKELIIALDKLSLLG
ncbi:hypothetical protein CROQUDRAFT_589421 [Cronartium quercuum f. sp. fusiforme G11]|uniref:DUF605-domain-containing protein n=1 Tax=Cronartium quercuum f. sp. fusiforme G11 TaxID=708437 RepID=A0A9P6TAX9_9BASI|nr:hypothetical protein CROQUDRAFT_589421 [Cronartium quercuum f. sp. fusiforme G11]